MARRVGFWIAWYVLLLLLWLAFVDTFNPAEMALGLVAAAIAATAAEVVRSQELVRFRMDPRWLRDVPQLPWQVLRDCWLLTAALAMCCERGWRGFKAEWVTGQPTQATTKPRRKQLGEGSSTNYGDPA